MRTLVLTLAVFIARNLCEAQILDFYYDSTNIRIDTIRSANEAYVQIHLGKQVSHYKIFHFGTLIPSCTYTMIGHKKNGSKICFYVSGKVQSVENYILDVPVGVFIEYYENGQIKSCYDYGYSESDKSLKGITESIILKSNEPPFMEYDSTIVYYKKLNGYWFYYYENGKIERIESYENNQRHGIWKYFNKEGNLLKEEVYKESIKLN